MTSEFRFPVEVGNVLAFRRAIGHDDEQALLGALDDLAVPPTYVAASAHFDPDSRLRPRLGRAWPTSSGHGHADGSQSNSRMMHAEQHFEYHRAIRPGQTLRARTFDGAAWSKQGRRGEMRFNEIITEYTDETGELVVTSRAVRVELPDEDAQ
ncbi:MAG: MaoC family dehydratase N-terminal domain-containing protein [Mycetocola sp.]